MATFMLNDTEHDAVTAAVAAAEAGTDGEIVTVITARSDAYHDVALHYALAAMLSVTAAAAIWPALLTPFDSGWEAPSLARELAGLLVAQAIVFLLVRALLAWMPLRMRLTPLATRARRVRRRALDCFKVGAESRTAGHEGVLLYLSLAEHRAEIIADAAVHQAVAPERWGEAMAALVDEVRAGRPAAGMAAAVSAIGVILAEHLPKTAHNPNEIPDRLIQL